MELCIPSLTKVSILESSRVCRRGPSFQNLVFTTLRLQIGPSSVRMLGTRCDYFLHNYYPGMNDVVDPMTACDPPSSVELLELGQCGINACQQQRLNLVNLNLQLRCTKLRQVVKEATCADTLCPRGAEIHLRQTLKLPQTRFSSRAYVQL